MGEWLDPARIDPEIYRYWVNENPKQVLGGQLRLVKNHDPLHFQDDVKLPAHDVSSNVLSSPHSDNLRIYGFPNKFKGFKIIVRNDQGYLLMAHELHPSGPFLTDEGNTSEGPHFHQVDYDRRDKYNGMPGTKHIQPSSLYLGINPAGLLDSFKAHYNFYDGSSETIQMPRIAQVQKELADIP